jgi:hypothetical protein
MRKDGNISELNINQSTIIIRKAEETEKQKRSRTRRVGTI